MKKAYSINTKTNKFKKNMLQSLADISKALEEGKIESIAIGFVDGAGYFNRCVYTSVPKNETMTYLGIIELLRNRILENYNRG